MRDIPEQQFRNMAYSGMTKEQARKEMKRAKKAIEAERVMWNRIKKNRQQWGEKLYAEQLKNHKQEIKTFQDDIKFLKRKYNITENRQPTRLKQTGLIGIRGIKVGKEKKPFLKDTIKEKHKNRKSE